MLKVGLTGGIGSGKTLVSEAFAKLGVPICDADIAAREIVEVGMPALGAIRAYFGEEVIQTDGSLDRAALRRQVFKNKEQLQWLENLTHPLINRHLQNQLNRLDSPYAVLVSPLLLETEQYKFVDRILVVDVPEDLQLQRAMARDGNNKEQIRRIMDSQTNRATRLSRADDIIVNDRDIPSLKKKVKGLHQTYLKLAKTR